VLSKALETQLKETQKLSDMYREQVIELEDKLARIREEGDVGKELFKVCTVCCHFTHIRGAEHSYETYFIFEETVTHTYFNVFCPQTIFLMYCTCTHTHIHPFYGPLGFCPGLLGEPTPER